VIVGDNEQGNGTMNDDGGPAFPISIPGCGDNGQGGMSLRDYFAAQSLFVAAARAEKGIPEYELESMFGNRTGITRDEITAALAYRTADAMIARRSR
jgi:hypothetical protein